MQRHEICKCIGGQGEGRGISRWGLRRGLGWGKVGIRVRQECDGLPRWWLGVGQGEWNRLASKTGWGRLGNASGRIEGSSGVQIIAGYCEAGRANGRLEDE